jgi:hypothetical protein
MAWWGWVSGAAAVIVAAGVAANARELKRYLRIRKM